MTADAWKQWVGQQVVVDTNSSFVYVGALAEVKPLFLVLANADAHDKNDGVGTKEKYVMDAKLYGVKPNRKEVSVRIEQVVSVSRLDDVIAY